MSEIAYALTSSANSNGGALGGFAGNTAFYNPLVAVVMLLGRHLPMVFVVALAGSFAAQRRGVVTVGTLPTHRPLFVGLTTASVVVFSVLDFILILALGPLAEGMTPVA